MGFFVVRRNMSFFVFSGVFLHLLRIEYRLVMTRHLGVRAEIRPDYLLIAIILLI